MEIFLNFLTENDLTKPNEQMNQLAIFFSVISVVINFQIYS